MVNDGSRGTFSKMSLITVLELVGKWRLDPRLSCESGMCAIVLDAGYLFPLVTGQVVPNEILLLGDLIVLCHNSLAS